MRAALFAPVLVAACAVVARADEPRLPAEPRTMREGTELVEVADAFDVDDPLDVHVGLAYELVLRSGTVFREQGEQRDPVATFDRTVSRLVPRLEVGLYRDLAFVVRLPLALSDARELAPIEGRAVSVEGLPGEAMLAFPVVSPQRSGLEYLGLGIDYAPLSQARDRRLPTLRFGVEARLSIGPTMHACREDPPEGEVSCAAPGDVDRDGEVDAEEPDGASPPEDGVARGTLGLAAHAVLSRRFGVVEPFARLRGAIEVPVADRWDEPTAGLGLAAPPVRGEASLGVAVIPWENRERFGRLVIDGAIDGGVVGTGRDFGELFDAIGGSHAVSLRSAVERGGVRAYATGLETVEGHAWAGVSSGVSWQPSALVRLGAQAALAFETSHLVTAEPPCLAGDCDAAQADNPAYRAVLHAPGSRFGVEGVTILSIGARGTVMF